LPSVVFQLSFEKKAGLEKGGGHLHPGDAPMNERERSGPVARCVDRVIRGLIVAGCIVYGIMALVVVANVVGRFVFRHPVKGTVELVEIMMLFVAFFAVPFAAKQRTHITVGLFVHRFPERLQRIVFRIVFFLSAVIAGIITYQAILNTVDAAGKLHETTPVLFIPFAPLKFIMAFGCLILFVVLFLDTLHPMPVREGPKGGKG
jgi:TRAP-type C4-dicarboxylate transport system permease small subunit